MSYLLDTCILSKMRKLKKHPDEKLKLWLSKYDDEVFFLSVLTIGEIEQGINKLIEKDKKSLLENWLYEEVIPKFDGRILPITTDVASNWGKIAGGLLKNGIIVPVVDGLIAATALTYNMAVVTENINDFKRFGARLFNPWV